MNEQQLKALDDMLKVRLTLHDITNLHTAVTKNIYSLEAFYKENPTKGTIKDLATEYKILKKKLESIWDEMEKREMTPNEYLERFQEI
jgi:hypothetical protein